MNFVTLEEAKLHLRVDSDADKQDIELKIAAASSAISNYLKTASPYKKDDDGNQILDEENNPVVLFEVKAATLLMLGELYRNREGEQEGEVPAQWGYGYLPRSVVALLYPLRSPTIA